jgi:phage terminase large subunit-like protein
MSHRKPTAMLQLQKGALYGEQKARAALEPKPIRETRPRCPRRFSKAERTAWRELAAVLETYGLCVGANAVLLQLAAATWAQYVDVSRKLAAQDLIVETAVGPRANVLYKIQAQLAKQMQSFIADLGLGSLGCTYSKGEWKGQAFRLLSWQWQKLIAPLFGTLNAEGFRQYRTCYVEIPKKNGKTELCAALALYMLLRDNEPGAECYVAAADREQAGLNYQAAAAMVRANEALGRRLQCLDSRKRISDLKSNSFLQVLSSESYTKHGISPHLVVLITTTAGIYNQESIWWRLRTKAQQVAAGIVQDPRFLPVLFLADPEKDDPADEEVWKRVNPSLGQIFTREKIRQDCEEAKDNPVDFENFKRFRLNIPIRSLSRWLPMAGWDACAEAPDLAALRGRPCYGGLDLASTLDLTAFVLVFPPDDPNGKWDVLVKCYCPAEGILKRSRSDKVNYSIWQQQGVLTATPGDVTDYDFLKRDILEAAKTYQLREIGFDSWNASQIATDIMAELNPTNSPSGFQMVEMRQGAKTLNEPMKSLLAHVMRGQLRHGGHPVLRWCADNMVVRQDANGNMAPDKAKATEKIDLMVALIMAWGRAMGKAGATRSIYEERGLLMIG